MKRCTNCLLPDTKPGLEFENGVCSACHNVELKAKINYFERWLELEKFVNNYREFNNYDCIIPVSGGKDSHYQTYIIKEKLNLEPLLVSFRPPDLTEIGIKNLENLRKSFDVDLIEFHPKLSTYKKLGRYGLDKFGDADLPMHLGIFSIPFKIAYSMKIPLIIWGENSQLEYGGPEHISKSMYLDEEWLLKYGGFFLDNIDFDTLGLSKSELYPYTPLKGISYKSHSIMSIFLGYFINWDAFKQVQLVDKYGFNHSKVEGTYKDYENVDTKFVGLHDYFKFLKYGFGRATDHASIDIRAGRITREEGLRLVENYDGKLPTKYLNEFLEFYDLSLEEFNNICNNFNKVSNLSAEINPEGWQYGELNG